MDTLHDQTTAYKDKQPAQFSDPATVERPYHPALNDTTFQEAEALFELYNLNERVHAIVSFNELIQYVMPIDDAYQMLPLIARSTPNQKSPYSYVSRHKNTMPTVRVLSPFEYKCQWLAGYFNVTTDEITRYCTYNPMDEVRRCHAQQQAQTHPHDQLDYQPPQLDLPLELDPRVADSIDPEYT